MCKVKRSENTSCAFYDEIKLAFLFKSVNEEATQTLTNELFEIPTSGIWPLKRR
jgi:hypothetical protein